MGYRQRLLERAERLGRPARAAVVGAGQMGTGFVAQIARQDGVTPSVVVDIEPERARAAYRGAGVEDAVPFLDRAGARAEIERGGHVYASDVAQLAGLPLDIVLECSGVPEVAARVALTALRSGVHVGLMTVEADVTAGLVLAAFAERSGAVYTVCRGDEPVECLKLVEYVQDIGLELVSAGKGKNNPLDRSATPDALAAEARRKGMNPRMLCSFVDGTKTMIEMAALANAADLRLSTRSMHGPRVPVAELARVFCPASEGGVLGGDGEVDYATGEVAPGVFVVARARNEVVRAELEYLKMGPGPNFAFYRPYHLASIEAVLTIGEVLTEGRPSLAPTAWNAEVVAVAKRDLRPGERIDGIGGSMVHGDAVAAEEARAGGELPLGLAGGAVLVRPVAQGEPVRYADVELDPSRLIVALRRAQDAMLERGGLDDGLAAGLTRLLDGRPAGADAEGARA